MSINFKSSNSNLNLQLILYFGAVLSLIYAVVVGAVATDKSAAYHRHTPIAALLLWAVVEPIRLLLGINGNLMEKVSLCMFKYKSSIFVD